MTESLDIFVRISLGGFDRFPSSFVEQSLHHIESEIFDSEIAELEEIFKVLAEDFPDFAKDACRERIRKIKGSAVLIESAAKGSIIFEGAIAALAYWVVKNTIGETIKEAYKESELNDRLKKLLLKRVGLRSKELKQRLGQRFFTPVSDPQVIANVESIQENGQSVLNIVLTLNRTEGIPPKPSQLFNGVDG